MDLDAPISRVCGRKAFMTERTEVSFVGPGDAEALI
jgi:hypothetical protein